MISSVIAIEKIESVKFETITEQLNIENALNRTLAQDVISPINMPPFRQSAMDGYAIKLTNSNTYNIIDESKAGDGRNINLNPGEAARIFTGAMVPNNADTVVIQENVTKDNGAITITKRP